MLLFLTNIPIPYRGPLFNLIADRLAQRGEQLHVLFAMPIYAIGGRNGWLNIDLVNLICRLLDEEVGDGPDGSYSNLITFVTDRPGHDARYAIDPAKIEGELDWRLMTSFEEGLRCSVKWYAHQFQTESIGS